MINQEFMTINSHMNLVAELKLKTIKFSSVHLVSIGTIVFLNL